MSAFIIKVKTDNLGDSNNDQFVLTGNPNLSYDFTVDWGDGGTPEVINSGTSWTHTFPSAGTYSIEITENVSGGFPAVRVNGVNAADRLKILEIEQWGTNKWTNFTGAFYGCENLTITATDHDTADTSSVSNWSNSFRDCSSLVSFPLLNTSSGTDMENAWRNCTSLTTFPVINTSNVSNFRAAWFGCSSLTSFPSISLSSADTLRETWMGCSSLTSFPSLNLLSSAVLNVFREAWRGCSSLTSFPNLNFSNAVTLRDAWRDCSSLTSFPAIAISGDVTLWETWRDCSGLISFPIVDTSNASDVRGAWYGCSSLVWFPHLDTTNATNITDSWNGCTNLKIFPDLDFSSVDSGAQALIGVTLDTYFYNRLLSNAFLNNINNNITFHGGNSKYHLTGQSQRNILTSSPRNWTITDGGFDSEFELFGKTTRDSDVNPVHSYLPSNFHSDFGQLERVDDSGNPLTTYKRDIHPSFGSRSVRLIQTGIYDKPYNAVTISYSGLNDDWYNKANLPEYFNLKMNFGSDEPLYVKPKICLKSNEYSVANGVFDSGNVVNGYVEFSGHNPDTEVAGISFTGGFSESLYKSLKAGDELLVSYEISGNSRWTLYDSILETSGHHSETSPFFKLFGGDDFVPKTSNVKITTNIYHDDTSFEMHGESWGTFVSNYTPVNEFDAGFASVHDYTPSGLGPHRSHQIVPQNRTMYSSYLWENGQWVTDPIFSGYLTGYCNDAPIITKGADPGILPNDASGITLWYSQEDSSNLFWPQPSFHGVLFARMSRPNLPVSENQFAGLVKISHDIHGLGEGTSYLDTKWDNANYIHTPTLPNPVRSVTNTFLFTNSSQLVHQTPVRIFYSVNRFGEIESGTYNDSIVYEYDTTENVFVSTGPEVSQILGHSVSNFQGKFVDNSIVHEFGVQMNGHYWDYNNIEQKFSEFHDKKYKGLGAFSADVTDSFGNIEPYAVYSYSYSLSSPTSGDFPDIYNIDFSGGTNASSGIIGQNNNETHGIIVSFKPGTDATQNNVSLPLTLDDCSISEFEISQSDATSTDELNTIVSNNESILIYRESGWSIPYRYHNHQQYELEYDSETWNVINISSDKNVTYVNSTETRKVVLAIFDLDSQHPFSVLDGAARLIDSIVLSEGAVAITAILDTNPQLPNNNTQYQSLVQSMAFAYIDSSKSPYNRDNIHDISQVFNEFLNYAGLNSNNLETFEYPEKFMIKIEVASTHFGFVETSASLTMNKNTVIWSNYLVPESYDIDESFDEYAPEVLKPSTNHPILIYQNDECTPGEPIRINITETYNSIVSSPEFNPEDEVIIHIKPTQNVEDEISVLNNFGLSAHYFEEGPCDCMQMRIDGYQGNASKNYKYYEHPLDGSPWPKDNLTEHGDYMAHVFESGTTRPFNRYIEIPDLEYVELAPVIAGKGESLAPEFRILVENSSSEEYSGVKLQSKLYIPTEDNHRFEFIGESVYVPHGRNLITTKFFPSNNSLESGWVIPTQITESGNINFAFELEEPDETDKPVDINVKFFSCDVKFYGYGIPVPTGDFGNVPLHTISVDELQNELPLFIGDNKPPIMPLYLHNPVNVDEIMGPSLYVQSIEQKIKTGNLFTFGATEIIGPGEHALPLFVKVRESGAFGPGEVDGEASIPLYLHNPVMDVTSSGLPLSVRSLEVSNGQLPFYSFGVSDLYQDSLPLFVGIEESGFGVSPFSLFVKVEGESEANNTDLFLASNAKIDGQFFTVDGGLETLSILSIEDILLSEIVENEDLEIEDGLYDLEIIATSGFGEDGSVIIIVENGQIVDVAPGLLGSNYTTGDTVTVSIGQYEITFTVNSTQVVSMVDINRSPNISLHTRSFSEDQTGMSLFLRQTGFLSPSPTSGFEGIGQTVSLHTYSAIGISGDIPLYTVGNYERQVLSLFLDSEKTEEAVTVPLNIYSTENTSTNLYLNGDVEAKLPLFLKNDGVDEPESWHMPLYLDSNSNKVLLQTDLYLHSDSGVTNVVDLIVRCVRSPKDSNMPLYIERNFEGNLNTVPLYLSVTESGIAGVDMYLNGVPVGYNTVDFMISGEGVVGNMNRLYTHGF